MATEPVEVYLTTEQVQRLAALSLDALAGMQISTTVSDRTPVTGCFVDIDEPQRMKFFSIDVDGRFTIES